MALQRLDKILSDLGLASRREVRAMIKSGRVLVDGRLPAGPELKLDPETAAITLDGEALCYRRFRTFMMDKPAGVLTATEDRAQPTVIDLLPPELRRLGLFPVGRLDKDTTGLLLLTNDGDLAHRILSPRSDVPKRYRAQVDGVPDEEDARAFAAGLVLGDGTRCLPALLECSGSCECFVTLREGKYHQVKRMLAARGKPVLALRRVSVGGLTLEETLGPGGLRELTESDLCTLFMDT